MFVLVVKKIRKDPQFYKDKLATRGIKAIEIDEVISLDRDRRKLIQENETLKEQRNKLSRHVGLAKMNQQDTKQIMTTLYEINNQLKLESTQKVQISNKKSPSIVIILGLLR